MIPLVMTRKEAELVKEILDPTNLLPPRWDHEQQYCANLVRERLAQLIYLDERSFSEKPS